MSNYFETGHAKNVANLLKLNQLIATFGTTYNPSNNAKAKFIVKLDMQKRKQCLNFVGKATYNSTYNAVV